ncbi:MAG: hypothetical protein M3P18_09510 [Actinomycetota bacterium]|nr:hypothetical protein [Actinomycetota bacterium]
MRVALLTLVLIGAGCTETLDTSRPTLPVTTSTPSGTPVAVEATDASRRTACATRVLEELVRAFNAGDAPALERVIGAGPIGGQGFQWVSFHDGVGGDAEYTAEGARRMLLERSSRGQRLTLLGVDAGEGQSWHGGVDAAVRLESRAPGVNGAAPISGKTALSCIGSRVFVLSIGAV